MPSRFAVIMAGGRGERLWPLSNPAWPKQFLKLFGPRTMLQETVVRIAPLIPKDNVYIVVPQKFTKLVFEQLDIPKENVIVEPFGRNTAPCVGLAAIILETKAPKSVMVVLPADHVIQKPGRFLEILTKAIEVAENEDYLVTLGIIPNHPATGYGYIRRGTLFAKSGDIEIYHIERFTEKPDRATAEQFLREGEYYWNSGIFIWRVDVILAELKLHMPKLYSGLMKIREYLGKPALNRVVKEVYKEQESISIDYGVMEKTKNALVIPAEIGWNDVGDWSALETIFKKDKDGNVVQAHHIGIDTKKSIIYSDDKNVIIATIGLEDVVIVRTKKALLVMNKSRAQDVREIVKKIKWPK
ncbi:MAG: mannose-1-phosphate guanylyltransferase [Candidatus Jordarchaeales archaeon]